MQLIYTTVSAAETSGCRARPWRSSTLSPVLQGVRAHDPDHSIICREDWEPTYEPFRHLISDPPLLHQSRAWSVCFFLFDENQTPPTPPWGKVSAEGEGRSVKGWAGLRPLALGAINQNKLKSGPPQNIWCSEERACAEAGLGCTPSLSGLWEVCVNTYLILLNSVWAISMRTMLLCVEHTNQMETDLCNMWKEEETAHPIDWLSLCQWLDLIPLIEPESSNLISVA